MKNQPYTKEFIHEAIIQYHRNVFGYTQAPDTTEEIRDAYFILGFTMSALDYLEKMVDQPEKFDGSEPEEELDTSYLDEEDEDMIENQKSTNKIMVSDEAGNSATVECTFSKEEEQEYNDAIEKGIEEKKMDMKKVYAMQDVAQAVQEYTTNPVHFDTQKSQGSFVWFKVAGKQDFGTTFSQITNPYEIAIKLQKYVSSDEGTLKDMKEILDEQIMRLAMTWFGGRPDTSADLWIGSDVFREHFNHIEDRIIKTPYGTLKVKEDRTSDDAMYILKRNEKTS